MRFHPLQDLCLQGTAQTGKRETITHASGGSDLEILIPEFELSKPLRAPIHILPACNNDSVM
jgi:hypothetical protein